jgi:uncharacterized protein YecE (DUF72 family)
VAQIWVGLSGWSYPQWRGVFYPTELPSRRYLEFYAQEFLTTEINSSFYRLVRPQTYQKWTQLVPQDFVFAVKVNRLFTHIQRLHDVEEPWQRFTQDVQALGSHLGPILLQFPQSFKREERRLADFLQMAQASTANLRLVCEFRHASWFTEEIYRLLHRYGVALCSADSSQYPRHDVLTTDFIYYRLHGRTELFASSYSVAELEHEVQQLQRHHKAGIDVYVYFNNTMHGHALNNARTLLALLGSTDTAERIGSNS